MRVPFRTPEREVDRAPRYLQRTGHCLHAPMPRDSDVVESYCSSGRGGVLVEETNQGFETFKRMRRMDSFLEEYRTDGMDEICAFCNREVPTRGHHVVPRCKGGRDIAPTCHSCEDFIHKTWTHNELRDTFNTVQKIRSDPRFRKFLRWLYKQQEGAFFRTRRNRDRTSQPYR